MSRNWSRLPSPVCGGRVFPWACALLMVMMACAWPGCDRRQAPANPEPAVPAQKQTPPSPAALSADSPPQTPPNPTPPPPDASASRIPETERLETKQLFHPNGSLKREWVVRIEADGTEINHGPWQAWHENGQQYLFGQYADGERTGMWYTWFPNGQTRGEGAFVGGQKDGTWTRWDEQGNKRSEQQYDNGLENGPYIEWDEQGNVVLTGNYIDGRKEGTWTKLGPDGPVETIWRHGEEVH